MADRFEAKCNFQQDSASPPILQLDTAPSHVRSVSLCLCQTRLLHLLLERREEEIRGGKMEEGQERASQLAKEKSPLVFTLSLTDTLSSLSFVITFTNFTRTYRKDVCNFSMWINWMDRCLIVTDVTE